jgi:hypothetical protein
MSISHSYPINPIPVHPIHCNMLQLYDFYMIMCPLNNPIPIITYYNYEHLPSGNLT